MDKLGGAPATPPGLPTSPGRSLGRDDKAAGSRSQELCGGDGSRRQLLRQVSRCSTGRRKEGGAMLMSAALLEILQVTMEHQSTERTQALP
jgi:hypothetical protein